MAGIVKKMLFGLIMEDAITREENAFRFYESALEVVGGAQARILLKKLCAEELRHRIKLEELQRHSESEQLQFKGRGEIELLDEGRRSWPRVSQSASYREILELALDKEKHAARYYQLIGGRSLLRGARELFKKLAAEESAHVRWVEKMLAES